MPGAVLLLVAHPDDEVLGASLLMQLTPRLHLIHATDAAFAAPSRDKELGRVRYAELDAALTQLGVKPLSKAVVGLPDGRLIDEADVMVRTLVPRMAHADVIVTHAYEGGHPDHDSCALAAHLACKAEQRRSGRRVPLFHFPLYAMDADGILLNRFQGRKGTEAVALALTDPEQERKRAALAQFVSQQHVVARFPLHTESLGPCRDRTFNTRRPVSQVLFAQKNPAVEAIWREKAERLLSFW